MGGGRGAGGLMNGEKFSGGGEGQEGCALL